MNRFIAVFSLLLLVAATPVTAKDIQPSKLSPPTATAPLRLKQEFKRNYTTHGVLVEHILAPGVYTPEYSGEDGQYFRGPENAVTRRLTYDNKFEKGHVDTALWEGGVLITPSGTAMIYFYVEAEKAQPVSSSSAYGAGLVGNAVNAYLASRNGKISFPPKMSPNAQLAALLTAE